MIHVGQLGPTQQWDQTMVLDLLNNELYPTSLEFKHWTGYPTGAEGCILIIPGRYWAKQGNHISESLSRYKWVLALRTSDEEDLFDPYRVYHPNIKWWVQTPRVAKDYTGARAFGVGYTPHFKHLPLQAPEKRIQVFLSAQNTHTRRAACFDAYRQRTFADSHIQATSGFTQGLTQDKYRAAMLQTRVAPAPSGAESPDSFRVWEALQAHAIPIADDLSPTHDSAGYWNLVCPGAPFPVLQDAENYIGYTMDLLKAWPTIGNDVAAWWCTYKRRMTYWLIDDLKELGAL